MASRLKISEALPADPALPHALDKAREAAKGENKIGTTGRGIGPTYEDKVARRAIRVQDLFHPERFAAKLGENLAYYNFLLKEYFKTDTVDFRKPGNRPCSWPSASPMVADVSRTLYELNKRQVDSV